MKAATFLQIICLAVKVFCSDSYQNLKTFQAIINPTNILKSTSFCGFLCDNNELPHYTIADLDEVMCQTLLEAADTQDDKQDTWLVLQGLID